MIPTTKINRFVHLFLLTSFLFLAQLTYSQIVTIYISSGGDDITNDGSEGSPVRTLEGAQERITSPGDSTYNIILLNNVLVDAEDNNTQTGSAVNPQSGRTDRIGTLTFYKKGSANHPITIFSKSGYHQLTRHYDSEPYMIRLKDAQYVNFKFVEFHNAVRGSIIFDNADFCSVSYCKFSGNNPTPFPGGIIWLGVNDSSQPGFASYNTVSNNYFNNIGTATQTSKHHPIYVSINARNNVITQNTIISSPSYGIHCYHGEYKFNNISRNLIQQKWNPGTTYGIVLGYDSRKHSPSSAAYNYVYSNYVYDTYNSKGIDIYSNLAPYNSTWSNKFYKKLRPNDPFWLNYDPNKISDRMVSGDFDNDGINNDIAAFYNYGNETRIHVWRGSGPNESLTYPSSQGWWSKPGYNASKISGTVVCGDFDHDGKKDDIAAFYNPSPEVARIDVWLSNGSSFIYSAEDSWWLKAGYDTEKIKGRVVCGDFDEDNYEDDIAVFYDYGGSKTRIHTFLSNGIDEFIYSNSAGWWSYNYYYANAVTNRVVTGDFDNDGYNDDIATFYDYHSIYTRMHLFTSTGNDFQYSGSPGVWYGPSYKANNISKKVVSGDFDNDGVKDDIAAFYDNGSNGSRIDVWKKNATSFSHQSWWSNQGYYADKVNGRVVSGNFGKDSFDDDIITFYDYNYHRGNLRSHLWTSNGGSFDRINGSLGLPWLTQFSFAKKGSDLMMTDHSDSMSDSKNNFIETVSLYPNPANDYIFVKLENKKLIGSIVTIYSIDGKKQLDVKVNSAQTKIDISKLNPGIYILRIDQESYRFNIL